MKKVLNQGISNKSYLLDNKIVQRIKANCDDIFMNPLYEEIIINELKNEDFVEKVISFDKNSGNKTSVYIPNTKHFRKNASDKNLILLAKTIRRFHKLNIKVDFNFEPFKRLTFYKKDIDSEIPSLLEEKIVSKAKKLYEKYPLILTHNDLVSGNILFKGDKIYLLDFEYAANNIALFDIASVLSENKIFDEKRIKAFCGAYGDINIDEVKTMMSFLNVLWYYWAKHRYSITKKTIFKKISEDKLKALNL